MTQYHGIAMEGGKLKLLNKDQFKGMTGSLPDGSYVMVLMSMSDKSARDCQNRYYAQIGEWANDVGESKTFIHDLVKHELFVSLFDEPLSTNDLSAEQWTIVFYNLESFLLRKYENK